MQACRHPFRSWPIACLGLVLICGAATWPGCKRQSSTPNPPPSAATNTTPAASAQPSITNPSASGFLKLPPKEQLLAAFQNAPEPARQRVQAALQSFQAGQTREGIAELKRLDADTPLTPEQQQAIAEWIRSTRR